MIKQLKRISALVVTGMAFFGLVAGLAGAHEPLPLDIGGEFALTDQQGAARISEEFDGKLKLVWFGYTECPHTCSMALGAVSAALGEMGPDGKAIVPLFVTVDPEHDTPARLATYLANFHPSFVGLTGTPGDLARLQAGYKAAATQIADPGKFKRLFEHTTFIYLMGRNGEPLSLLPSTLSPDRIEAILRGYL